MDKDLSLAGPSGEQDLSLLSPSDGPDRSQVEFANQLDLRANENNDVEGTGLYRDLSTEESDVDDPAAVAVKRPTAKALKDLKSLVSYVIYEYEGARFPALVHKCHKKTSSVVLRCMNKGAQLSCWTWPKTDTFHTCEKTEIVEILSKVPSLRCARTCEYYVERMKAHGWKNC